MSLLEDSGSLSRVNSLGEYLGQKIKQFFQTLMPQHVAYALDA